MGYVEFSGVFIVLFIVVCCLIPGLRYFFTSRYGEQKTDLGPYQSDNEAEEGRQSVASIGSLADRFKDRWSASSSESFLEMIGKESVYSFFLSSRRKHWAVVIPVVALQMLLLFFFVDAAQLNFADDKSDFIYAWNCPRNDEDCKPEEDDDAKGWFAFAFLMVCYLLGDFFNGIKLLWESGDVIFSFSKRRLLFAGGACLCLVSSFTVYTSIVYNLAIARSNTDVVSILCNLRHLFVLNTILTVKHNLSRLLIRSS